MQTFTFTVVATVMALLFSTVSFAGETPAAEKMDGAQQSAEAQQPAPAEQSTAVPPDTGPKPETQAMANDAAGATSS